MTNAEFNELPMSVLGGGTVGGKSVHIAMRTGFDRPTRPVDEYILFAAGLDDGCYKVDGSEDNPLASWPVYALVKTQEQVAA
jgi:hypothetical protein